MEKPPNKRTPPASHGFQWNNQFAQSHPAFEIFQNCNIDWRNYNQWPDCRDFLSWFCDGNYRTLSGKKILFVDAAEFDASHEYESVIFQTGYIPTRSKNWHDFLQILVWKLFPATKAILNARHFFANARRQQIGERSRSPIENAITLFDESGAIVVSSNPDLLEAIRQFRWRDVFLPHERVRESLCIFGFGHAFFEKMLSPYIGLTAPSVLVETDDRFFKLSPMNQLRWLDNFCSRQFQPIGSIQSPNRLQPVPVLGFPGWWRGVQDDAFYRNSDYFRPGRRLRGG